LALVIGCGDQFRPTISVIPTQSGNPAAVANVVMLATNPATNPPSNGSSNGSDTHIDVGGDSSVGVVNVGTGPVFLGKAGSQAFILNSDNTVSLYSAVIGLPGVGQVVLPTPTQLSLPPNTSGAVGGAASKNGNIYIAQQGACGLPPASPGCVSVISSGQSVALQDFIPATPATSTPVMVAANANNDQVYVINQKGNSVTVIGDQDNAVIGTPIPVGNLPIWGVMSDDGIDVFVVNQGDGTVSVIDTTLNSVITTLKLDPTGAKTTTLDSNFAFYDKSRKRVYVTNPGDNSVTVIKADGINLAVSPPILPIVLAKVTLSDSPISVAAIADGTRAYAALGHCPTGTNHTNLAARAQAGSCTGNQVSVINAVDLIESKLIPVGSGPVSLAVSSDGSKVYTANSTDKSISIIKTSTDAELLPRKPAPQQSLGCTNPNCNANGPQTPFMVVTFP
jgi:YVTN family beta-propeller protein